VLDSLIFSLHAHKKSRPKDPLGGSQFQYVTLQKQTSLLTHCTNPRPLKLWCEFGNLYWSRKSTGGNCWHVTLHKFAPKSNQATDWPHLNCNTVYIIPQLWAQERGEKSQQIWSDILL
jgi:hypothetical protein